MDVPVGSTSEVEAKIARVRGHLERTGLGGVLITRQDNFAWLTGGRDNHVLAGSEIGVASLLVTRDARVALANRIEAGRLRDEEIGEQGWDWRTFDWYRPGALEGAIADVIVGAPIASDVALADARPLDDEFDGLRADLLPDEVARYREVGRLTTEAIVQSCQSVHPGQTEHEIAADLSRRVRAHGVRPNVVLVAADERIGRYRHPIPTEARVRDQVMLVIGGVKWGLHVSATRFVGFHPLADDMKRRWRDVSQIAAYFTTVTRPGRRWSDVFRGATELYGQLGWPDEWELHHQGGPTGYRAREVTATFDTPGFVATRAAAAWNPSITGTKSEDTIVVDATGHEFLTRHGEWPTIAVEQGGDRLEFPGVLIRQQVVRRYA